MRTKKLKTSKTAALLSVCAAMALCINLTGSCSADDDYFGLDDESYSYQTRAATSDNLGYLSLSSYNPAEWTDSDYTIMSVAAERIGVSFSQSKNKYVFSESSGKNINVSDSLYNLVKSQYELTNTILNTKSKRFARMKRSSAESTSIPDCVPRAISNMGKNKPSYADAVAACDEAAPNWRTDGGVTSSLVGPIIRKFVSVTTKTSVSFTSDTSLNKCVMLIPQSGNYDHAVNATQYVAGNTPKIYYYDYQNERSGTVNASGITSIYLFD